MFKNRVETNPPTGEPFIYEAGTLLEWSDGSDRNHYMVVFAPHGEDPKWINLHTGVLITPLKRGTAKALPSVVITAQK